MLTVREKTTGLTEQLYFGRQFSQAGGWENIISLFCYAYLFYSPVQEPDREMPFIMNSMPPLPETFH